MAGDPESQCKKPDKPPRRYWNAAEPFFDLRLSHWIQGFLTLALLTVAGVQAAIYFTQARIMRGQLQEMKTESAIRQSELAAKININIDRVGESDRWSITSIYTNVGKSDAIDFNGWDDFRVFHSVEDPKDIDFLHPTSQARRIGKPGDQIIVIAGETKLFRSKVITNQDSWDIFYGRALAVIWGYAEYTDIFDGKDSVRWCATFNFELNNWNLVMTLPIQLRPECNRRTHQKKGQSESP